MSKMGELASTLAKERGGDYSWPYKHYHQKPNESYFITRKSACCHVGAYKDMIEVQTLEDSPVRLLPRHLWGDVKVRNLHTGFWRCYRCGNLTSTYENYMNRAVKGDIKILRPVFGFLNSDEEKGWELIEMTTLQFRTWIKSRLATFWACSSKDKAKELGCPNSDVCSWCSPEGKKKAHWLESVKANNPNKPLDFWTACPASIDPPKKRTKKSTAKKITRSEYRAILKKKAQKIIEESDMDMSQIDIKPKAKKKTKNTKQEMMDKMFSIKEEE